MVSVEIVRCRIPELLFRLGRTQSWLAEETGYSRHRISEYANKRVIMSVPVAKVIALSLKLESIDLLHEWRIVGLGRE